MAVPAGLGACPPRRVRDCVSTADRSGDPRRRLEPLPVAAPAGEVATAVLRVVGRLPGGRVLERGGGRVRARASSRVLRVRTEVVVVVTGDAVHARLSGPRGIVDPRTLCSRGREVLAAIDAELRGWPVPTGGWLRR